MSEQDPPAVFTYFDPATGESQFVYAGKNVDRMDEFNPGLQRYAGDYPAHSYRFVDGEPVFRSDPPAPPPQPLPIRRQKCRRALQEQVDYRARAITDRYSEAERATWPQQEREAIAVIHDNAASAPLIATIAAGRGQTVAHVADIVLSKSAEFRTYMGALIARRKDLEDQIDASADPESIDLTAGWPA